MPSRFPFSLLLVLMLAVFGGHSAYAQRQNQTNRTTTAQASRKPATKPQSRSASPQTTRRVTPAVQVSATPKAKEEATQNLEKVRQEINSINRQLVEKKRQQQEAAVKLQQSERAIHEQNRNIIQLQTEYEGTQKTIEEVRNELQKIEQDIAKAKAQLAILFRQQYLLPRRANARDLFRAASSNKAGQIQSNPQLASLARVYQSRIARLTQEQRQKVEEIQLREGTLQDLTEMKTQQQEEQKVLTQELQEKQNTFNLINQQLDSQQTRLASLKKDEARLGSMVQQISRRIAAQEKERQRKQMLAQQEAERQRRLARDQELAARKAAAERGQPVNAPMPTALEKPILVEAVTDQAYGTVPFEQLKGRLKYPVSGHLMNQFGAVRKDSGTPWKGIFIQAPSGQPVKSIASGRVVFSDWMRGYGNLVIVDHGQGYLSIYGHNDTLLKGVGAVVKPGETIASVGNTGGLENFGLYFELRHQDKPIDPMKWVKN